MNNYFFCWINYYHISNENLIFLSDFLGSAHGPLRSSLKKPKNRDVASVSSKSSSKQVRISLGAEQTAIWNSDSIFSYSKTRKNRQFVPIFLQNCCSDYIGSHITVIKKIQTRYNKPNWRTQYGSNTQSIFGYDYYLILKCNYKEIKHDHTF